MNNSWTNFTVSEWLQNLEDRNSQEIQLGLDRISVVAERLNLLSPEPVIITIAGTNGKGSTVAVLEAIYQAAGYETGSYTSPHLMVFQERIRVNSISITEEALCIAFSAVEAARKEINLTNFEMTTLAALWHFKKFPLAVIILEVGLGGRLDATNIIDPDLAIITTIDFDHQDYLGNTLEAIAYEKAGILRPDIPCIYADYNPPLAIVQEAVLQGASMLYYGRDFVVKKQEDSLVLEYAGQQFEFPPLTIHYHAAAAAIMAAICLASRLPVSVDDQYAGLKAVNIPGRLELHKGSVNILYDVSHNPQGARLLADYVRSFEHSGHVHAVFSAFADKNLKGMIHPLRDCVDHWYPAQLNEKRAASEELLISAFKEVCIDLSICYRDPESAFQAAIGQAKSGDLVIIYGSFRTVAAVRGCVTDQLTVIG